MDQKNISTHFKMNFLKIFSGAIILFTFILILLPFYLPIILGAILAMAFSPLIKSLIQLGIGRIWSLILLSFLLFLSLATPLSLMLIKGSKLMGQFLSAENLLSARNNQDFL